MRILVDIHQMDLGGSQINAVELAWATADLGHEVHLVAPTGVLVEVARAHGLHVVTAARQMSWPTAANMRQLTALARTLEVDVVHGYEWGPALDVTFGPHARLRLPAVMTIMAMRLNDFLPTHLPTVVGTPDLARRELERRPRTVCIEPPVDVAANSSGDVAAARARWGFAPDEIVVTVVCRMVDDLEKAQGVERALRVLGRASATWPLRFLVVGDGERLSAVRRRARAVNARAGREVVVVTGALVDPRPAYDAADVVLGMGGSALRGMAFGKPLVVQGAHGFWRRLDEATLEGFLRDGWYGDTHGRPDDLLAQLEPLLRSPRLRAHLGAFGRRVVVDRFSLEPTARRLEAVYLDAVAHPPRWSEAMSSISMSAVKVARFKAYMSMHRDAA